MWDPTCTFRRKGGIGKTAFGKNEKSHQQKMEVIPFRVKSLSKSHLIECYLYHSWAWFLAMVMCVCVGDYRVFKTITSSQDITQSD